MSRLVATERWLLRGGVFLLPLAYWWGTYDHYVLPKLLLARVIVIGLLILLVARTMLSGTLAFRRTALDLPLLIFVISAALSTLFAYSQNVAVFGTYSRFDGLLTTLTYAALFWLAVQVVADEGEAQTLVRTLLASGYLVAGIAIIQSASDSVTHGAFIPAFGTLGQKNVLGIFLAMLSPLAVRELMEADSWSKRILAFNVVAVILAALALSLSRSAWLGAALGAAVLIVMGRRPTVRVVAAGASVALLATLAVAILSVSLRAWGGEPARPIVWRDSLALIASRPILGYGPDNFGLVYPRFQSRDLGRQQWDKAHAETLQLAATQGLIGLAAYIAVLAVFVRAFWRGRHRPLAIPIFAALIAYEVTLQLNFTALPAAFPFWVIAAVAMASWGATRPVSVMAHGANRVTRGAGAIAVAALVALAVIAILRPSLADARLLAAVTADVERRRDAAEAAAAQARELAPQESVYATEVANIAFEHGDWARAAGAYLDAAHLGTYNPLVYRNLALADRNLGRFAEARVAARKAYELDRFDPANRALLAQFEPLPS